MTKRNTLVLLSGGVDSAACVHYYKSKGHFVAAIYIDYGQIAMHQEITAAKKIAKHFGIGLNTVVVSKPGWGETGIPYELPGRNMLFAAIALSNFAWKNGLISMGLHAGTPYRDCSIDFQNKLSEIAALISQGTIAFDFPFGQVSKKQVAEYFKAARIPIDITYSCQTGDKIPCGRCPSCLDRLMIEKVIKP